MFGKKFECSVGIALEDIRKDAAMELTARSADSHEFERFVMSESSSIFSGRSNDISRNVSTHSESGRLENRDTR